MKKIARNYCQNRKKHKPAFDKDVSFSFDAISLYIYINIYM